MLVYRAGWLHWLFSRLRAVGQMAFTNYIVQTVICSLVFFGYGLNQFAAGSTTSSTGSWPRSGYCKPLVSPLWLRAFQFGPLEWLWRTLTYGARQPFLRRPARSAVPVAGTLAG